MAEIKFAPGLVPVLKHLGGKHDQKTHAGGGGGSTKTGKIVGDEVHVGDLQTYLPGSEGEWQQDLDAVSQAFEQWGVNYETRLSSATIMGLEGGFSPRGQLAGYESDVDRILKNPTTATIESVSVTSRQSAEAAFKDTTLLMDASTRPLPEGTRLYRGARLLSDDPRRSANVGDEFEMPLSAFATERTLPEIFARGGSVAPGDSASQGLRTSVLFTVEGASRGHVTRSLRASPGDEVVAQGRFRVKDRKINDTITEITLEQVSYYDVRTGGWSDA